VKIKYTNNKKEYTANLDQTWVWVRLEDELGLTVTQAQDKMGEGSTKVITYAIWLAAEADVPYETWIKKLGEFEVVSDDPKDMSSEASSET
jgi:hypothetical protein